MRLELGKIFIKDIQFASESKIENNVLYVNKDELRKAIWDDEAIVSVEFDIAKPGESVRITPVKDVIEPRVKVEGRGELARNLQPEETKVYETKPLLEQIAEYPDLPKVGYVYMLQTQGLLHDTYVYGVDAKQIVPTILYPTEIMDGAIVSGNCVSACDKNPTYVHLNNGVIEELYEKHGKEINFLGVIITNRTY